MVVDAAAQGIGKRSAGSRQSRLTLTDMPAAHQGMNKGAELSDLE